MLVIDPQGRVVYRNAAAAAVLSLDGAPTLVCGIDRCWRLCDRPMLDAVRGMAASEGREPGARRVMVLPARGGGARWVIHLEILAGVGESPAGLVLVRLQAPLESDPVAVDAEVLRQCFDLTAAEAEVASAMVLGLSPAEISRKRGVSRTTTAFHLRNLFAKTGTRRQPDLVRTLLAHAVRKCPSGD